MRNWKAWLVVAPFIGLQMFTGIFICWVLLYTILCAGMVWLMYRVWFKRSSFRESTNNLKVYFARVILTVVCSGGLYFFLFVFGLYDGFLDLPAYFKEEYAYQEGYAHMTSSSVAGRLSQTITINGVKMDNHQFIPITEYQGRHMRVYYLPHTKYVMEIWVSP